MELNNCKISTIKNIISGINGDISIYGLCRNINMTYSHVHKVIKLLEEKKLLKTKKQGRAIRIIPKAKLYDLNLSDL